MTFIATQSMPIVSYLPIICATIAFEPTPSVHSGQTSYAPDIDHVGEIADRQLHRADPGFRPCRGDAGDDVAEPLVGLGDIDTGLLVAVGEGIGSAHVQLLDAVLSVIPGFAKP